MICFNSDWMLTAQGTATHLAKNQEILRLKHLHSYLNRMKMRMNSMTLVYKQAIESPRSDLVVTSMFYQYARSQIGPGEWESISARSAGNRSWNLAFIALSRVTPVRLPIGGHVLTSFTCIVSLAGASLTIECVPSTNQNGP